MTDGRTTIPRQMPSAAQSRLEIARTLRREGFRVGRWRVEPRRNLLVAADGERNLEPRLVDLLICLASRPKEVVTKDELLDLVWQGAFVSDNTVSQAVSRLRNALGDDSRHPAYLETIPKSGYRLIAAVLPNTSNGRPEADSPGRSRAARTSKDLSRRRSRAGVAGAIAVTSVGVALLVAGVLAAIDWLPAPPTTLRVVEVRPESTLVGNQFEPSLSPDGDRLAFAWLGPDRSNWDIWVHPIGGDGPVRLTDDPAAERLPAWSPDGESIAFVRFSEASQECGIFRIPAVGGRVERLRDCLDGMRALDWSPLGGALIAEARGESADGQALFLLDLKSGQSRQLTHTPPDSVGDRSPRFSPDGSRIAFVRAVNEWRHNVMVIPADGGGARALSQDAWGQIRGLEWTPDGQSVLFSSNRAGQFALWRVAVEGGEITRIPIHDEWVTQPRMARRGGRLIYRTFRDSVDLWQLSLGDDGEVLGEPTRRAASTRSERQGVLSPDGERLAFLSDRTGSLEVWSGGGDGEGLLRHTDFSGPRPGALSWSADGKRLAFDAAVQGQSDLWSVGVDSRTPDRLTDDPSEERNPTFSRDGRFLYFGSDRSGRWEIWRMPANGGPASQLTRGGGFLARENQRGDALYYSKLEEPGIWRLDQAQGSSELIFGDLDLSDWGSWEVDHRGLWFVTRNPTTISFLGFGDEQPRVVYIPPKQMPFYEPSISLSADGRSLLFSMIDHSDDEVMRVEVEGW